ncbi:MAG: glycosyltransferase [Planctomycetota bacterium]|jgi:glycosyltransferase involved in cell wall biosynthesis|nr:glycosyltransferase [Planctomycetota bacterium]MDP6763689.1 glycosyltransferase [Planctomycetota bacterium]MDP6989478.1 glycosyltransferase [Planctomycetota bacterium]
MVEPENKAPEERLSDLPEATLDVTIVLPVQTADGRVREVVEALGGELTRLGRTWECVPVFDGVRGSAWEEATALEAANPEQVRPLAFQQRFGESACLSAGLESSRGRVIVTSPQYVQIDPSEIGEMLHAIDEGADLVVPWRKPRVDPLLNRLQSIGFNLLIRRIIGAPFHDLNCYLRAMRREALAGLAIYGDMYRFLPVVAYRQGYAVEELQVRHVREWGGAGMFGLGVYVRRVIDIAAVVFLTRFTLQPLRFFGALGGLFALVGAVLSGGVLVQKLLIPEAGVWNRPLFLLGVMLFVLGVQVVGFGLVGEIIIYTRASALREYRIERVYEQPEPDA